jgi:hypothetical protein
MRAKDPKSSYVSFKPRQCLRVGKRLGNSLDVLPSAPELGLLRLAASHRKPVAVFLTCAEVCVSGRAAHLGPDGLRRTPLTLRPLSGLFLCDRPQHPNSPPGSLRAGLLLDRAVSGNHQISICRAPWHGCPDWALLYERALKIDATASCI